MKNIKYLFLILFFSSCQSDLLETVNPNAPDLASTLANPNDWEAIIQKQFNVIWGTTQDASACIVLTGMADVATSSWGDWGMRIYSSEPRVGIINGEGWTLVEFSYYENFKVIGSVNDILRLLAEQPDAIVVDANGADIRQKLNAAALFLRGMAYGNLALRYDKAQYITEQADISQAEQIPFEEYPILLTKAIADLEAAINTTEAAPDFVMAYFNGLTLSKSEFIQFIRTLQAKYQTQVSRNTSENETNDWSAILNYARQGIQSDIIIQGDGIDWMDDLKNLLSPNPNGDGFARIDYRLIAVMAENTPSRFPEDDTHPLAEPRAIDQRLLSDMTYYENIVFRPNRGLYHFSHYAHTRYQHLKATGIGAMPWILKAENDLLLAEALIHTGGNKTEAATLINATRVNRGGLPPLTGTESEADLLDAIMHEQLVELIATNGGQSFFDRRRRPNDEGTFLPYTGLQKGTPTQLPVPAKELNVLGMEVYTFGGS